MLAELEAGRAQLLGTWCRRAGPSCPLPAGERRAPDIRFLGLDEGFVAEESVTFLDEVGVTYEQFVDEGGELAADLEITELPATVVLDADGASPSGARPDVLPGRRPRRQHQLERGDSGATAARWPVQGGRTVRQSWRGGPARRTSRAATMRLWRSNVT